MSKSKLTPADVREIVALLRKGTPHLTIADRYGITRQAVSNIATGKTWRNVTGGRRSGRAVEEMIRRHKLGRMFDAGIGYRDAADVMLINHKAAHEILRRHRKATR